MLTINLNHIVINRFEMYPYYTYEGVKYFINTMIALSYTRAISCCVHFPQAYRGLEQESKSVLMLIRWALNLAQIPITRYAPHLCEIYVRRVTAFIWLYLFPLLMNYFINRFYPQEAGLKSSNLAHIQESVKRRRNSSNLSSRSCATSRPA